jgi:hypothetical protein
LRAHSPVGPIAKREKIYLPTFREYFLAWSRISTYSKSVGRFIVPWNNNPPHIYFRR